MIGHFQQYIELVINATESKGLNLQFLTGKPQGIDKSGENGKRKRIN